MIVTNIRPTNIDLHVGKTAKNATYNSFYASKFQDYVEEGHGSFRIYKKPKNHPYRPQCHLFLAIITKLGYATSVGFVMHGHKVVHDSGLNH